LIEALIRSEDTSVSNSGEIETHSSLTVFSEEFVVFLGYKNLELMSDLADWFDNPPDWDYDTIGRGSRKIIGPWVNILGATTPELIRESIPKELIGGGLASRIIFVYAERQGKDEPFPFISEKRRTLREGLMHDLEQISMLSGPYRYTPDFKEVYAHWYPRRREIPLGDDPKFAHYVNRRATHVLKLCMILSASRGDDRVLDGNVLIEAIGVLQEVEKNMSKTFAGMGKARDADVISKVMVQIANEKTVTREHLLNSHYADLENGVQSMNKILEVLKGMGFCVEVVNEGKTYVQYARDTPTNGTI
jgi:DNA-binding phage protein